MATYPIELDFSRLALRLYEISEQHNATNLINALEEGRPLEDIIATVVLSPDQDTILRNFSGSILNGDEGALMNLHAAYSDVPKGERVTILAAMTRELVSSFQSDKAAQLVRAYTNPAVSHAIKQYHGSARRVLVQEIRERCSMPDDQLTNWAQGISSYDMQLLYRSAKVTTESTLSTFLRNISNIGRFFTRQPLKPAPDPHFRQEEMMRKICSYDSGMPAQDYIRHWGR